MTKDFYAMGLGASAGGLNSMIKFFSAIPEYIGVSFIVFSHLLREHRSNLAEILARKAALPVVRIDHDVNLSMQRCRLVFISKKTNSFGVNLF